MATPNGTNPAHEAEATPVPASPPINGNSIIHDGIISSLDASQSEAFNKFIARCREAGLLDWPSELKSNETLAGINDEVTLLRFLRARKFDVDGAFAQLKEAWDLRSASDILNVYEKMDVAEYDEARQLYPHWTGRRTKQGQPVILFDLAYLDFPVLAKYNSTTQPAKGTSDVPQLTVRALAVHDGLVRFVLPLCSAVPSRPSPQVPISSGLYLVDIASVSAKQLWNAKKFIQDISKLLSTNYPELLDKVLIFNAPFFFPRIWPWVKPWLDPVTAGKIQFIGASEQMKVLGQYIDVKDIPKRYGGELEFTHGMMPKLDGSITSMLSWSATPGDLPTGPVKWITNAQGQLTVTTVGTEGEIARNATVAILQPNGNSSLI